MVQKKLKFLKNEKVTLENDFSLLHFNFSTLSVFSFYFYVQDLKLVSATLSSYC